jgi:hypothetical protein
LRALLRLFAWQIPELSFRGAIEGATFAHDTIRPAVNSITLGIVRRAGINKQDGRNQASITPANMIGRGRPVCFVGSSAWLTTLFSTLSIVPRDAIDGDVVRGPGASLHPDAARRELKSHEPPVVFRSLRFRLSALWLALPVSAAAAAFLGRLSARIDHEIRDPIAAMLSASRFSVCRLGQAVAKGHLGAAPGRDASGGSLDPIRSQCDQRSVRQIRPNGKSIL